jgi:hypothetical protein
VDRRGFTLFVPAMTPTGNEHRAQSIRDAFGAGAELVSSRTVESGVARHMRESVDDLASLIGRTEHDDSAEFWD